MKSRIKTVSGLSALVTGAARGIGRAIAEELGTRGCSVIMLDINAELLERSVEELKAKGTKATAITCDLTDLDQIKAAVESVRAAGGIDILVNNAASIPPILPFVEISPEIIATVADVNFRAPLELIRLLLPDLKQRPAASIVNIASQSKEFPLAFLSTYAASKSGLAFFTECLRVELHGSSVHVLRVEPGSVGTEGYLAADMSLLPRGGKPIPPVEPSTIARAIISAMLQGKRELYFPPVPRAAKVLNLMSPRLMRWIVTKDQMARARKRSRT